MSRLLRAWLLSGFCACTTAQAALGQSLADPMRPPNVAGAASTEDAETEAPRQLQSVLFSAGRKIAVINGETVALGDRVGDGVVTKISQTEVVLKFPDRIEVLKLLGGIERKPVGSARAKAKEGK
jgi:MSHA biogenesis protein MshK